MTGMRALLFIRFMLLCVYFSVTAIGSVKAGTEATVGWNSDAPTQARLTDPKTGKRYIVALKPELDIHGVVEEVHLALTPEHGGDQNLLAPLGIYHGLQPYDFAALDFRRGTDGAIFGRIRRIPIRRTATTLVVALEDIRIRAVTGMPSDAGGSEEVISVRTKVRLDGGERHAMSEQGRTYMLTAMARLPAAR